MLGPMVAGGAGARPAPPTWPTSFVA